MPPSQQSQQPSNILSCSERQERRPLRRETPLQHYREDGTLIEGVVDLAFQENTPEFNGWTVVDFKTDREIENAKINTVLRWRRTSKLSVSQLNLRPAASCLLSRRFVRSSFAISP